MSTLWTDGDYTTALADGPRRWLRPFDDDFSQLVFEQDYQQLEADFVALPLDTVSADFPDAYLVRESPLEAVGGGVVKWTRTYSRIPPSRSVYGSYSWTVPGIGDQTTYTARSISSATTAASVTTITASASVGASSGDMVQVSYTYTDSVTGFVYPRKVARTCLTGTSGSTVNVAVISEPNGSITFSTVQRVEPGRDPKTEEVWSKLVLDYYLPGVSTGIDEVEDIPVIAALEIFDNTGRETTSFSSTTSPTLATWRASVATQELVCVVSSIPRRWMGNIYERATRYVRAK